MTAPCDISPSPKFPLGQVVATPGALELLARLNMTPLQLLARHACGDWGDVSADDALENDLSVERGCRLLSAYKIVAPQSSDIAGEPRSETLWIITECDRSVTTLLLPRDY